MKKLLYWLPGLVWMFIIFGFSAQPSLRVSSINWQDFIIRKTAHFIEYFILYVLYLYALRKSTHLSAYKVGTIALLLAIIYAITDEAHQLTVIGREGRLRDVIIDSLGASFGLFLSRRW